MIQRPGYFDPFRHPDRAEGAPQHRAAADARRTAYISDRDYALAIEAPLTVPKGGSASRWKRRISWTW